jgi:conjugal transfer ATP-binding protein TraC
MLKKMRAAELQSRIPIHEMRDNLLILADGSVAVGYQVDHVEDESLDEAGYQHLVKHFTRTVQHFPVDTVIQKLDIYYVEPFEVAIPPSAGLLKQKELAYYQNRPILQHQALLYVCFPALKGTYSPHNTYFAKGSSGLKNPFARLDRTIETAQKYSAELATSLTGAWKLTRLRDEENLAALYAYLNLDFTNKPTGFEHTMTLSPSYLQLGHKRLQVISMQSQADEPRYCSYNGLGNGQGVATPFIGPLTHYLPFPHMTIQAIRLLDTEAFLRERTSELAWSQGAKTAERGLRNATIAQESLANFETALRARGGAMSLLDLQVLVYDTDPALVEERVEETKKQFKKLGMRPFVETYDTANLFFSGMPGAGAQLYRGVPMSLETAVAYLNTIQPRKTGDPTGILLADRHKRPIYYDPFNKKLDNRHAIIFGPSGSGKSFFNGKMIKDRYAAGHRVIVVDSGGTYRRLFQALGGKYIEYSPDEPLHLNPFLLPPIKGRYYPTMGKINFLVQLVGKMWKGDLKEHPLSEVEKSLLDKWISQYYQGLAIELIPSLTHFYGWLQEQLKEQADLQELEAKGLFAFQEFFIVLETFATGSYKELFNSPTVDYLTDHRLICFELEAVKNLPRIYPLVVQVLFDLALEIVAQHPSDTKFIDIEEGWAMLNDCSESYIEGFFRGSRKKKTSIRIITQSLEEIKESPIVGAMKDSSSILILLYNDKESSRQEMGKFFGLSALDMDKYASLSRKDGYVGYREVLIREMKNSKVWMVDTSLYEHAMITSEPDERNRITELIEDKKDVTRGICAWVQEVKELIE